MQGIFIALDREERRLLVQKAKKELRTPDDHARFILRSVLMNEPSAETSKPVKAAKFSQDTTANGFGIGNS